ncbi:MAG: hypothetical protein LBL55_06125 [Propionibacteriaceae bacterium]|jgi:hypothetical protein|nr:hypothetical protein [Propionibacteriaceae bacterium]
MSRYYDWSPLGCSCDPVPGDPDTVQRVASEYQRTADAIREARDGLNRLSHGGSKSQGLQKLLDDIKEVRGQLDKVEGRVAGVAQVLAEYHPVLRSSQELSLVALREAEAAASAGKKADRQRASVRSSYNCSNDPDERERLADDFRRLDQSVSTANGNLRAAKEKLRRAIKERDEASRRAQNDLQEIDDDSPVRDTLGDRVGEILQAVGEVLKAVYDGLKYLVDLIADNAWWLTIALAAISIVFPLAALICGPLITAISIVSKINLGLKALEATVAVFKAINGSTTWDEALIKVVDVGAGAVSMIVSAKVGKGVEKVLRSGTANGPVAKVLLNLNKKATTRISELAASSELAGRIFGKSAESLPEYAGILTGEVVGEVSGEAARIVGIQKVTVKPLFTPLPSLSPLIRESVLPKPTVTTYNRCCSDGS